MPRQTTPNKLSTQIKKFLRKAHLTEKPIFLAYRELDSRYMTAYCLDNCRHAMRMNLGEVAYGWMIWECKKLLFIEAEFHSVLKVNGKFRDITPRKDGEERILFVPDPTRTPKLLKNQWMTFSNIQSQGGEIKAHTEIGPRGCNISLLEDSEQIETQRTQIASLSAESPKS